MQISYTVFRPLSTSPKSSLKTTQIFKKLNLETAFEDQEDYSPTATMFPHNHRLTTTTTTSDEADSNKEPNATNSPPNFSLNPRLTATTSDEPNATNDPEVVPRRRGRPMGSKNKRKSPASVTREPDPFMSPIVLEVSDGSDIVAAVNRFRNRRKTGVCVLNGSGAVSNVSFRQPTTTLLYQGRFTLLTISATILPPSTPISTNSDFLGKFMVSLAGPEGQTVGGVVVGPLIASGTVNIVAVSFNNPHYNQLPMGDNNDNIRLNATAGGSGSVSTAIDQASGSSDGGDSEEQDAAAPLTAAELLMSTYGCNLPLTADDIIWAPTP